MPPPLAVPEGYQPLVNPSGEVVYTPIANVAENIKLYGYRPPTSKDMHHAALKKEYGDGFGDELAAGIEGVLSGATFGISRHAENILGLTTPEAQAARKEFNPTASMAGEALGTVGSLLLAPEVSLPGLVGKGSVKAGTAVAGRLIENKVAKEIAARTVGSALEGLAYGAVQPISETALGDPTITAQKAFHQIGLGALIGGGLGAVTSALGVGIRKPFVKAAAEVPETIPGSVALEGEGVIVPKGPMKMEGVIDFGVPDEKILERAAPLNPKNPLKKNDLDWLKANGEADAAGKPTIFQKIGTPEVPTMDPLATDQVYMGDSVKQGMKNLQAERVRLNAEADKALAETVMPNGEPLSMTKKQYTKIFKNVIEEIEKSKEFGLPIGKKAVRSLEGWMEAAVDMPDNILATDIRDILQNVRNEGKIYVKGGGLKGDFVSKSIEKVQDTLDSYLKDNSPSYKAIQEEFAPFTRNSIELEDHLGWNWQRNDSDLVSDWVTNRVAKPFYSALPGTKGDAELMRWFSKYAGVDFEKASKANFIFGKLNPQAAQAGQLGPWGGRLLEGFEHFTHPTELPGKVLKGAAKIALTGELPEFFQSMRTKGVQDLLLGKSKNVGAVESILSKFHGMGDSELFNTLGSLGVPASVKLQQFVSDHDTVEEADQKLEVLFALEKAKMKADKMIQSSVDGIFSGKVAEAESARYQSMLSKSSQERAEEIEKLSHNTQQMVNDPELLMNKLSESLGSLGNAAPNVAAGVNMTAVRALQFLSGKLKGMQSPNPMPLDAKYVPSRDQISTLAKSLQYINAPFDVLKEIQSGMVSREGKEVLQAVYPELYQELKGAVLNGIADAQSKGKHIPMSKRLGLTFFTGQSLDGSINPQSMSANQATFAMPMATQSNPNPMPSSAKHLGIAGRYQTPLQKVADRK